jgi:lipoprotein signal peptidase
MRTQWICSKTVKPPSKIPLVVVQRCLDFVRHRNPGALFTYTKTKNLAVFGIAAIMVFVNVVFGLVP